MGDRFALAGPAVKCDAEVLATKEVLFATK
jgi:hypothetical protein